MFKTLLLLFVLMPNPVFGFYTKIIKFVHKRNTMRRDVLGAADHVPSQLIQRSLKHITTYLALVLVWSQEVETTTVVKTNASGEEPNVGVFKRRMAAQTD